MKLITKKGITSKIIHVFISDSSSTTGDGLTGLVYNSAGLTSYYIREGDASVTAITLADATVGVYTSGGFKEVDATNMPGIYELHLPDACFATGADQVVIFLKGAANMVPLPLEIQLRDNTEKDVKDIVDAIKAKTDNLPSGMAKNVAVPKFDVFMVLSSDHVTGATGKTVTGTISKDGGAFSALTNPITEVGNGVYTIASGLTQDERNADVSTLKFSASGCDDRIITIISS